MSAQPADTGAEPALATARKAPAQPAASAVPAGWRPAPPPLSVLRACGWLAPGEDASAIRVDRTRSSHLVFRLTAPDGRCVVVKQLPQGAAAQARSLRHELFVYRLAAWMPQLAALMPAPLYLDEQRQVVVLQSLSLGPLWPNPALRLPLQSPGVARQIGTALAHLHRSTLDLGMWPSPAAGVLGLCEDLTVATQGRAPAAVALMQAIVADNALQALLREGLAGYRASCVIHGDLRPENWALDERAQPPTLRLFDWEIAGAGDPLWDLGSLVAEALAEPIRQGQPADFAWLTGKRGPVAEALQAYLQQGGLIDPQEGAAWRRLAVMASARLLHLATECAEQGCNLDTLPVLAWVNAAKGMASSLDSTAATLRLCAGAWN